MGDIPSWVAVALGLLLSIWGILLTMFYGYVTMSILRAISEKLGITE